MKKKLDRPVTLFVAIESRQHERLRKISFSDRKSIADVVREAINGYIAKRRKRASG